MNLEKLTPEKIKQLVPYALLGLLVLVLLLGLHPRLHTGLLAKPALKVGDTAPATDLPLLSNDGASFTSASWRGRPYVVNFFGSWCPDCRAEHDQLLTLAASKVTLIGITYRDHADKAAAYLDHSGNPYLAVALDADGLAETSWKLGGVPETFVVDGRGIIRWHFAGVLSDDIVTNQLMPAWESCLGGK